MLAVPEPILAYLTELAALRWSERDTPPPPVPAQLPEGAVTRVLRGGPFGWLLDARLDRAGDRLVLEVLEDDRMSGPGHYRVWDDGTREDLPTEHTTMVWGKDATDEEIERVKEAFYAHNGAVQAELRERGFRGGRAIMRP